MNKVTVIGRIFTTFMSNKILIFNKVNKDWSLAQSWFEIRFQREEDCSGFLELVKDIDRNKGITLDPLNVVKITFENPLTEKDRKYMREKDKSNEIENRKFCDKVIKERTEVELKLYRARLKETEESIERIRKSIKELEEKLKLLE